MGNAITTKSFGVTSVILTIDVLSAQLTNFYVAICHSEPWANESSPDIPTDTNITDVNIWRSMYGGKKIAGNEFIAVVPLINWTANTVYAAYNDQDANLYSKNFYVMNNTYSVYKCVENNYGANSTVQPTYTATGVTNQTSDLYIWKYMFTISASDRTNFLTSNWMPVKTLSLDDGSLQWQVQNNATSGINSVLVINGGIGYNNTANITVVITGDGAFCTATANINLTSQTVTSISVTNPGSGYHYANAAIVGGGGSGATANVVISPFGGHGSDPVNELGASSMMSTISFNNTESGKLDVQNAFRQFILLRDPLIYGTTTKFANTVFSQSTPLNLSAGSGNYILNESVFQGSGMVGSTFSGTVLDWDPVNSVIYLTKTSGNPTSAALIGLNSGTARFIIGIGTPDVQPYSGNILYIDNFTSIQRANNQSEIFQFVFSFSK